MMRRTRYDLIHAVKESAFIAAAVQAFSGVPYVYDMDSSLAEQWWIPIRPWGHGGGAPLCESVAVRRSLGVLTVCAALEDVALAHSPGKPVGGWRTARSCPPRPATGPATATRRFPRRPRGRSRCTWGNLERYQGIDLILEASAMRSIGCRTRVWSSWAAGDDISATAAAARLGILPKVHFLGPKPVYLLPILREADVLVSPRVKGPIRR